MIRTITAPCSLVSKLWLSLTSCSKATNCSGSSHLPALPAGDLNAYADMMARAGHRVVYVDVTTPDIRNLGLRVVRTLAAGLQPLHFGYGRERRGGRRLYEVPLGLGYFERARRNPN